MIGQVIRSRSGSARIAAMRVFLLAVLLVGAVSVLATTAVDLVWFRDVGYPDSASLLRIGDYTRGGAIYPDPNRPPYYMSLYGPLFYILMSLPCRFAADIGRLRIVARLTMLGFLLLSLALVFSIVYRLSGSARRGAWALAFASAPAVIAHWTTQIRADLLGISFSLLSVYCLLGPPTYSRLLFCGICAALALLCKQTFIAAPCAVLLYLLYRRRVAHAAVFFAAVCLGTALGYGLVIWKEPWAWPELTTFSKPLYRFHTGLLLSTKGVWNIAPLFAMAGVVLSRSKRRDRELLPAFYCLIGWVVAFVSIMQVGGSTNYFLEPLIASAAVAALALPAIEAAIERAPPAILLPVALGVALFAATLFRADGELLKDARFRIIHYDGFRADFDAFAASVTSRPLLSSYPDITIYSRAPQVPDTLLNTVLVERGLWSWEPVIQSLNRSEYELLAMYPYFMRGSGQYRGLQYWNSTVFETILRNYQLAGLCAGMEIWTPRKPAPGSWKYLESEGCRPPDRH